jgi:hypothetical protein
MTSCGVRPRMLILTVILFFLLERRRDGAPTRLNYARAMLGR